MILAFCSLCFLCRQHVFLYRQHMDCASTLQVFSCADLITISHVPLAVSHIPVFVDFESLSCWSTQLRLKVPPSHSSCVCTWNVNMGEVWFHELVLGFLICNSGLTDLSGSYWVLCIVFSNLTASNTRHCLCLFLFVLL